MKRIRLLLLLLATSGTAAAQGRPVSEADRLFDEGLTLLDAGKFDEACAKLEASHKVEPAPGTLLALGDCQAKAGRAASAVRTFKEASEFARRIGDAKRAQAAMDRALALGPRVSYLKIEVTPSDAAVTVRRDGAVVEPSLYGVPVPLDPSVYSLEATASGRVDWRSKVELKEPGTVAITVPALALVPTIKPPPPTTPNEERPAMGTRRKVALGLGALGIVGLGVGGFFGIRAASDWSAAKETCAGDGDLRCTDPVGLEHARDAQRAADVSTVVSIVGVVAVGAAVVLWLTDAR